MPNCTHQACRWLDISCWNEVVGTLLLDLSKAFDLVNHSLLLQKPHYYGLHESAVVWFKSYLNSRKQDVYVSGAFSDSGDVVSGVPQGSVIGPTLFLLYINDMPLSLSNWVADIFADDTTLSAYFI